MSDSPAARICAVSCGLQERNRPVCATDTLAVDARGEEEHDRRSEDEQETDEDVALQLIRRQRRRASARERRCSEGEEHRLVSPPRRLQALVVLQQSHLEPQQIRVGLRRQGDRHAGDARL